MPEDKAALPGQATSAEVLSRAAESANSGASGSPFFEDVLPSGEKKVYATREEFAKEWQKSRMMNADYTRKTQDIAAQRKQHEEQQKKFEDERKQFLEMRKRYDGWDEKLRSRPDVQRQLEQYLEQPENPGIAYERAKGYVDETKTAVEARIETLEKRLADADSKREIEDAFSNLKAEFPDADEGAIMARLEEISDGKVDKLIRQLYFSHKGQLSPAQVEQKVVENLQKKEAARMVPTHAAHKTATPKITSTEQGRTQAYKDFGLDTGG